ncbi:MAG: hypothetical protein LBQ52_10355 [Helicobacteraceae bacterium]|jgi:hypothetical protein|nr:hypothetical protein [Helicobacteraceae bacterium]
MEKTIVTSCSFPLIKLDVNLTYDAVQKPSGVGYIILVLIKDAKDHNEPIRIVLKRFGVPDDLQFIFADEIDVLLNRGILQLVRSNSYQREYFEKYAIADFAFTANGERMFREGAIPTGEEKIKQTTVYYNPLTFEFSFTAPNYTELKQSYCYHEGFMERVETDFTGLKEYLIDNARNAELQKEERLLECSIAGREDVSAKVKENLELRIDEDGMEVSFKTAGAEDFYKKYFTPDMLERTFAAKDKFKFSVPTKHVKGFSDFKALSSVYLPEEYAKQIARFANLLITRNKDKISIKRGGIETTFENEKINSAASAISSEWSFITIDPKEMRFYTAANIELTERVLDKPVSVSLLVEQLYGADEKTKVIKAIFDECAIVAFSTEHCGLVKAVYELSKNADYIAQYTSEKIKQLSDRAKQSEILLAANKVFVNPEWSALATQYAKDIYSGLIAETTKENIGYNVKIVRTLDGIRKPEKNALLLTIAEKFGSELDDAALFILLTDAGFSENDSLSVANAVKVYVDKILAGETELEKSKISDDFAALSNNLDDLKKNLGIRSATKYAFRDGYDIAKFTEDFKAFQSKLSELKKKYAVFAPDGFGELAKYEEIMQPVFDYIIIERNASQRPEKISESYIRSKINAGDWRMAIFDMFIRLEYILSKRLDIKKSDNLDAHKKINRAKEEKIITESEADALHTLRKFRNNLTHPTDAQLVFDKVKITKWADAVFSIAESKPADKKEGKK